MSNKKVIKKETKAPEKKSLSQKLWLAASTILTVLAIYFISQVVGLVILIYPVIRGWTNAQATHWVNTSTTAQFLYIAIVELVTVLSVFGVLKLINKKPSYIDIRKPKKLDPVYGIAAYPIYYVCFLVIVIILGIFIKSLNVAQHQNIGFNNVHDHYDLIITFISLVILAPIGEEILVRGYLYSGLRKAMPKIYAAVVTSLIFASAHLPEGKVGLLWIGFIDTFTLSMVLVFLRERTKGLYAGMTLHALKNGVAYYVLYLAPLIMSHR